MQKTLVVLALCVVLGNIHAKSQEYSTKATNIKHANNAWLGTYSLQRNLYEGSLRIQKCDINNICKALYFALLDKSEFNDMHQCDITLKLQIKSQQEAIAYYDDFVNCKIYIKKNPQGIVFTRDERAFNAPDSFCNTMRVVIKRYLSGEICIKRRLGNVI